METPPSRQAQFQFAERLVAGILQRVFRVDSNARLRSRDKLHAHLLLLNGVAGTNRDSAPRCPKSRDGRQRHRRETRVHSNAQDDLIVSGKSQKQKQRAKVCKRGRGFRKRGGRFEPGKAALPAAAHALEISSRMIALGFARRRFLVRLRVCLSFAATTNNLYTSLAALSLPAHFRLA